MFVSSISKVSLLKLIRKLTDETKTFIRQEIELAKTEFSEKMSRLGRNGTALAIGGVVAYAGFMIFLVSLAFLLAFAFQAADIEGALAHFLGFVVMGLLAAGVGGFLIFKAIKNLSKESLAPEKALDQLRNLQPQSKVSETKAAEWSEDEPSSDQVQARVVQTEERMAQAMREIAYRVSPRRLTQKIKAHPFYWNFAAIGSGAIAGFLLRRRWNRLPVSS